MSPPSASHPFRGMLLLLASLFFFSCTDATIKYLTAHYNVPLVVAIRYIVNCALIFIFLAPSQGRQLVQTQRTGLVWVRSVSLAAASLFVALSVHRLPVAEMTAIVFLGPMLVVLIARPLLGERIGALGWAAALTGFAGVLLIARPSGGLDAAGVIFGLCAAGLNAAYQLLSRTLIKSERTITLLFHSTLVGSICFGLGLPWYWSGEAPTALQTVLFVSMGTTAGIGHYLFTAAFRHATASMLAPVNYVQLLWAGLLGWILFGHIPDGLTVLGMCIVAASGVMIALKSRKAAAYAQAAMPPSKETG